MSSRKKAPVYISVYTVRPRRSTGNHHVHRHHHHVHRHHHHVHHIRGGYDRKAELLKYSQQLRASARHEQAHPAPNTTPGKIVPLHRNLSIGRNPSCLGNCKRRMRPSFLLKAAVSFGKKKEKKTTVKRKTYPMGKTMHANGEGLRVEKQQGFVKKLISAFDPRK